MNQENPLHKSTLSLEKEPPIGPKNLKGILGDWEVKQKNPGIKLKGIRRTLGKPVKSLQKKICD